MSLEDNPPAFPVELGYSLDPGEPHQTGDDLAQFPGMTLRDYFAAHAVAGYMGNLGARGISAGMHINECAEEAYAIADALLAMRFKASTP